MKISKDYLQKPQRDPHLHSPAHVLADEISRKLGDTRHFGFYLKTALTVDHNVLRKLMGDVLEKANRSPGALFAYLVKKYNREKNVSHGCSVWLLPEPVMRNKFDNLIKSLATSYSTVQFPVHLSIISNLPLETSLEPLAELSKLKTVTTPLLSIQTEEIYFKSFYLPVEKTKELNRIRRLAKKLFAPDSKEKFNPHLSLMYGNFKPDQKPEMLRLITKKFPEQITFSEIALARTEGLANDWQIIKSVPLTKE